MKGEIKKKIVGILEEGPSTSTEVAIELGMDLRLISAHLCNLREDGLIKSSKFAKPGRMVNLYSLADAA